MAWVLPLADFTSIGNFSLIGLNFVWYNIPGCSKKYLNDVGNKCPHRQGEKVESLGFTRCMPRRREWQNNGIGLVVVHCWISYSYLDNKRFEEI